MSELSDFCPPHTLGDLMMSWRPVQWSDAHETFSAAKHVSIDTFEKKKFCNANLERGSARFNPKIAILSG